MSIVYTLSDPRTDELRYVGQTAEAPEVRLRKHCWPSTLKREVCHRTKWIKSLIVAGVLPKIEVVEEVSSADVDGVERFYIEYFKSLGFRLVNQQSGGDGWPKGMKRRPHTDAEKKAISVALKGRRKPPRTKEHTENNRRAQLARRYSASDETRLKLSKAAKADWLIRKNSNKIKEF